MDAGLRDLLDKIYELEGLIHLALKRDEYRDDFLRLISNKGKDVAKICGSLEEGNTQSEEPFNLEEYSIQDDPVFYEEPSETLSYEAPDEEDKDESDLMQQQTELSYIIPSEVEDRGRLVFSINDRFRFRKELFNNSDIDFNNSLALVASMDDYEEAEDYFINDVGLNPSDDTVGDFLEIVKRYFV